MFFVEARGNKQCYSLSLWIPFFQTDRKTEKKSLSLPFVHCWWSVFLSTKQAFFYPYLFLDETVALC